MSEWLARRSGRYDQVRATLDLFPRIRTSNSDHHLLAFRTTTRFCGFLFTASTPSGVLSFSRSCPNFQARSALHRWFGVFPL